MGFSRQGCWCGLPFPSPADRPYPATRTRVSCTAGRFFNTAHLGSRLNSLANLQGCQQFLTTETFAHVQASPPRPLWVDPTLFPTLTLPFLPPVRAPFHFLPPPTQVIAKIPCSYLHVLSPSQCLLSPGSRYTLRLPFAGLPSLSIVPGKSMLPFPPHSSKNLPCHLLRTSDSSPSQ